MRRNLFWLSDEQWRKIEPFLPPDVRGKDRVDDRRARAADAQLADALAAKWVAMCVVVLIEEHRIDHLNIRITAAC